ncbi:MAG: phosphopantothenoylcysteine decarboxylase, partial [Thermoanaerobaculia bacterium]
PAGVRRVDVETAEQMRAAVTAAAAGADLVIMAAAVADFRPRRVAGQKLKKRQGVPEVELEPTTDILAELATAAPAAIRVGFAAETNDVEAAAQDKLREKGAHWIVANDVARSDIGFGSEFNEVTVFGRDGEPARLERQPKQQLAERLLDLFTAGLERQES